MKITMESTEQLAYADGVASRVWNGVTEQGTKCVVFVHRIAVQNSENTEQFERELKEQLPPGRVINLRYIL